MKTKMTNQTSCLVDMAVFIGIIMQRWWRFECIALLSSTRPNES